MKRRYIITLLILIIVPSVKSFADGEMAKETYALSFGTKLTGKVEVDLQSNEVIVRSPLSIINLTCREVQEVLVENPDSGRMQLYQSGTFGLNDKPFFFEVLSQGDISLLYREGMVFSAYEDEIFGPYFVKKEDHIYALGTKKQILKIFGTENQRAIIAYLKNNKISFQKKSDLIRLFEYCQSL